LTFTTRHRWILVTLLALLGVVIVAQAVDGGVSDPTSAHLSSGAAAFNSGLLVFREGLESILVLMAIVASLMGANRSLRRPIAAGAGVGAAASIITWFAAVWIEDRLAARGISPLDLQAATGLAAIAVLLLVMNWFFHRVYWTGWISHHNRTKKSLLGLTGPGSERRIFLGLATLGFASVYREGFEVVLFLQNMRLAYGSSTVLAGAAVALALIAVVGAITFLNHHRLPYKRMLVVTGAMLGIVLVVMVGEQVQEMQQAGWLSATPVGVGFPHWLGTWFATFANVEGLVAQGATALVVLGSYLVSSELQVRRPMRTRRRAQAGTPMPTSSHRSPRSKFAASSSLEGPTAGPIAIDGRMANAANPIV
jgi:high-affinity iron transporter